MLESKKPAFKWIGLKGFLRIKNEKLTKYKTAEAEAETETNFSEVLLSSPKKPMKI